MFSSHAHKKYLLLDDTKNIVAKCPALTATEEQIQIAFAHSKELHVKEMADIDKYTRIGITEFLEFIARLGVLLYAEELELLLTDKIERVLIELVKLVSERVKYPPKTEDDELVSDYEEDIVHLAKKKIKEANHEQFLIVDITKHKPKL